MQDYSGPCYTVDEALEKLDFKPSELRYYIETGEIQAVVYTKPRQFLLLLPKTGNEWVGMGVVKYRGHYTLHSSFIHKLLDGEKVSIGYGNNSSYGHLLDATGVLTYSQRYPFKRPTPHGILKQWRRFEYRDEHALHFCAAPLPVEQEPGDIRFKRFITEVGNMMKTPRSEFEEPLPPKDGIDHLELSFSSNSAFEPEDLRIPASEIERFSSMKSEPRLTQSPPLSAPQKPEGRTNELHSVIDQILINNPSASATRVWQLLEEDEQRDDRLYDRNNVIEVIDSQEIAWCSRYGARQYFKFSSLRSVLSRRRKALGIRKTN